MNLSPQKIDGVWLHEPKIYPDERGSFHEVFKFSLLTSILGREFEIKQVNQSTSKKGVLRGIHWTDSPRGQAKYVSCTKGSLWDVAVDLRPSSPTYGQFVAHLLSESNGRSLFISEGIGHAFLSLEDGTVANYLCTTEFDPQSDRTINPLDKNLDIGFQREAAAHGIKELILSAKDRSGTDFQPK